MKKITLIILLLFSIVIQAQVINEPANWPNTNWVVTGTYNTDPLAFEADPTLTANFSFNDDLSGNGNTDAIQAESPVIDLTAAFTAGETWLFVDFDYVFNWISSDSLGAQYWDADAGTWNNWGTPIQADTTTPPLGDFCTGTTEAYTSEQLNISGFTATQLSGFKYRLFYDDGGIWGWGFCVNSPTLSSQMPPACPDITGLVATTTGDSTADITWNAGNTETEWQIWVQPAGTGIPTTDGVVTMTNAPYQATGLTASTVYEVYVRANCGTDGYSAWIGPVNFTTFNTPPPTPVGVTCASGTSTFIFTEDFGTDANTDPSGWTGTGFDGSNGNWDITAESANSGGTGPDVTWDGNPGMHLEYEASGDATDIASAITPAIDLSTALDGAELSFYMHAFGANIGTLNVGVSTSQTGPFTTAYTWVGDYQSTADEAWVPIGINLDAYLGQVIYIEFSYGGEGSDWEGDLSIDQVRVETCGTFCIAPSNITATNITEGSADVSWTSNSTETQWNYVLQPAGTGVPTSGTTVSTTMVPETGLNPATDYEVYVQAICGADTSVWAGPFSFTTLLQFDFTLDCAVDGPQTIDYCYENNDTNIFTFTSLDGTPLNLVINAGEVENNWDELVILDSDGVTDLNAATPYGNGGDISGISYQSTGGSISFQVQSDGSVNCQGSGYTSINFTVTCATCINHVVDFVTVSDCDNGNSQFFIDVDIASIGDASTLNITDDQGSTMQTTTAVGVIQMGPYPLNTDVVITVANADDTNCIITSNTLNVPICPPANDECTDPIIVTANADENCTSITNATLYGATPSLQTNPCAGDANDDVWFQFTAISTDHGIDISNIIGDTTNLDHALYEGTDCNALTNLYCETDNSSIANGLTVGNTYYIRVFTAGDIAFQNVSFDLCIFTIPPPITTNDTQYTVSELVTNVLVNSPCAIVNNVTSSTGIDFGGPNGIGYFEANGSGFPFQSGIVMTTGNVLSAPGPETGTLSDGDTGWPGDTDLETVINEGATNNASIIEFEFTPLIDQLSFNFIFAAEEYGIFQCDFSDAFAFLLTDLSTGITTNIAVVPGTTDPVSVFTIRDNTHNGDCASSNPALFDAYYGAGTGLPAITNPTNFIGRTVPLTAIAPVTPNNVYNIKLVVADDGDTAFDSAVFLEASSFEIGEIDLGDDILLDSGLASCDGDTVVLDIGVPQPVGTVITWYTVANGITEPIAGETGPTLTVTESGTYQIDIIYTGTSSACYYSDDILIEFFENPEAEAQTTIYGCDTDNSGTALFDITENETNIIGSQTDVIVIYYETEQDALDDTNPIATPTSYTSSDATTIYFRVESTVTSCFKTNSFSLELAPKPVLGTPDNVLGCDNDEDGISEYDLTSNETLLADGQTDLIFTYYLNLADAETNTNQIIGITNYLSGATTIYLRAESSVGCFETSMFDLYFGTTPETIFPTDIDYEVCPNATTPITITAEGVNYTASEVSIKWYNEGVEIPGQTSLSLPTVLTQGTYTIEVTYNDTGCSSTADVMVSELETCVIPQGVSPNGDTKNDTFDLSSFDVQKLEIYNRNGRLVYSKENYTNEWEGQSDAGDLLPVGTYYYVMHYQGTKTKAAWIYLNR